LPISRIEAQFLGRPFPKLIIVPTELQRTADIYIIVKMKNTLSKTTNR